MTTHPLWNEYCEAVRKWNDPSSPEECRAALVEKRRIERIFETESMGEQGS